jgi:PhnB protein
MGKAVPDGFHTLTPYLVVRDCMKAIEFYKQAFGAKVRRIHFGPDKKSVTHADLQIGDSILMLNDEFPGGAVSPLSPGGGSASCTIHIFVEDVDKMWRNAVDAGAKVTMPLDNQFWGDRYGQLTDPFGHNWSLATHLADLSEQEIDEGMKKAFANMPSAQG